MRATTPPASSRLAAGVALLAVAVGGLLAGCSDGEGSDEPDRRIEMYGLVLDWVLEREEFQPAPDGEVDETPTVFVDHLNRDIDFDVQVGLVSRYEDRYELRFVDALGEAVDEEAAQAPVRDEGVLVGLGSVPDASPFLVRAEVYRDQRRIDAYRFELVRWAGDWVLRDEPQAVEPEGFVPAE
jgi:hypothetical protein